MVFVLSKILLFLLKPLVWVIFLFVLAICTKNFKRRKRLLITGLVLLVLFSNSFIVGKFFNLYESPYPPDQKVDVGIVLGGFSNINERNNKIKFGWAGDRLFQAISLYKSGGINKILVTSGSANLIDKTVKEGDLVFDYLKQIGIPEADILIENQGRNTIENASLSFLLIKKINTDAKVMVITSAWHIPRARIAFSKYFKKVAFYPTNYIGKTSYDFSNYVIPSAEALSNWELLFKEWIGLLVDRFRA
ncbi:YdcF family protein [Pedobacter frigiditerrae]|uniref:YdcF family protein n=1 Tax=Pedobacter frigiditerrae TaxID=2530452 RepID=UPI0029308B4D|nr:YdcF family protein [Pedobacter frigiditerrae]